MKQFKTKQFDQTVLEKKKVDSSLKFRYKYVSARNKGRSLVNDRRKTSYDRFKFFTADHSPSKSFGKAYNVSLFYKNMYILSQNSLCLPMFNSCRKGISSKTMVKKITFIPISFTDSTGTQYTT